MYNVYILCIKMLLSFTQQAYGIVLTSMQRLYIALASVRCHVRWMSFKHEEVKSLSKTLNSLPIRHNFYKGDRFSEEVFVQPVSNRLSRCIVKKIRRFYDKIPGIWLPVHLSLHYYLYWRLLVQNILETKIW